MFINGRAAVHAGSSGKSVAFPDVCLCPPSPPSGPIPTPLPNTARAADLQGCAVTVTIEGHRAAHQKSYVAKSTGNEVARNTGGGVITHATQGKAYFQTYSLNVFIEGKPAVRHMDLLTHNHTATMPGNTPPAPWMSTMLAGPGKAPKEAEKNAAEGKERLSFAMTDPEGNPLPGLRYRLTTPKGKNLEGVTPAGGKVAITNLSKGNCKIAWLDGVACVAKAEKTGAKAVLSGSPACDEVATGKTYGYVLKLEKLRIRVLDIFGSPLKKALCDVWIKPLGKRTLQADDKGWLSLWAPPAAQCADLKVVRPFERRRRRVHLRPLADDDGAATKQRLWNLGFYGREDADQHVLAFNHAYGLEGASTTLAKDLGGIESAYKKDDGPD